MAMRDEERASERVWIDKTPPYQPPAPPERGVVGRAVDTYKDTFADHADTWSGIGKRALPRATARATSAVNEVSDLWGQGRRAAAAGAGVRGAGATYGAAWADYAAPVAAGVGEFVSGMVGGAPPAARSKPASPAPAPAAPGTRSATGMVGPAMGRESSVAGIMRRDVGGVPEFYNQQNGKTPAPLGAGTVNTMPASYFTGGGDLQLDVIRAEKAAVARGDHPDQIASRRAAARANGGGGQFKSANLDKARELMDRAASLADRSAQYRDPHMRARFNRQVKQLQAMANEYATLGREEMKERGAMDRAVMSEEGANSRALLGAQTQMSDPTGQGAYNQARTKQTEAITRQLETGGPLEPPKFNKDLYDAYQASMDPTARAEAASMLQDFKTQQAAYSVRSLAAQTKASIPELQQAYREGRIPKDSKLFADLELLYGPAGSVPEDGRKPFAEGGLVEMDEGYGDMPDMEGDMGPYSGAMDLMGGASMPAGDMGGMGMPGQMDPAMQAYNGYAEGARKLGLPVIPYEQFLSLQQSATQGMPGPPAAGAGPAEPYSAMGFAAGGLVPGGNDVSNKMVVDTNPGAATDSIPAMIDGQQPAALDSGEMVLSEDVVRYLGVEQINKWIAKAKQGMANGADAGTNRPDGAALGAAQ